MIFNTGAIFCTVLVITLIFLTEEFYIIFKMVHLSSHERALFNSVTIGSCFKLNSVSYGKRPEYCIVVGKRFEGKNPIIEYKVIAYDNFFKRYDEGDIVLSSGVREFFGDYTKTDEDIYYFKYEKYS